MINLSSCSIADDRDICCDGTSIYIRYVREVTLTDRYTEFIKKTEHFWFDDKGVLLKYTRPLATEIQHPSLDFIHGKYTLLVLGNRSSKIPLNFKEGVTQLSDLKLQIDKQPQGSVYGNTDRLYWGIFPFEIYRAKQHHYIFDMSNIHCRLKVQVSWKNNLPSQKGLYSLRLENLPRSYQTNLHPKVPKIIVNSFGLKGKPELISSEYQVVHSFPTIESATKSGSITQELLVPMSSAELTGEFISFRYDDDFIPIFRVWKDGNPQMKEIDLTRFLRDIKWVPSQIYEQVLSILIQIDPANGVVTVQLEGDLNVKDWEDGGDINVNR